MKRYASNEILKTEELYELQNSFSSSGTPFEYQLTDGEYEWAQFLKHRYSIADFVLENTNEDKVLTFRCPFEMSEALNDDGTPCMATMLSNESALQKLFFWLNIND